MKHSFFKLTLVLFLGIVACAPQTEQSTNSASQTQSESSMNTFLSIFEIPATDFDRAVNFYQALLDIPIEKVSFPGLDVGVFPYENQAVTGVIMKGEDYVPSATGVTIYLNGGENLQPILDKVEPNGGKILVPKTPHADESGFFALFLDTEGNKIGLSSPQ